MAPELRLVLLNRAENVALVRQALDGLADALGLDESLVADMKTAVSEACNNVVLHAYDGEEGLLEVCISRSGAQLEVVVRDDGSGIQPRPPEPDSGMQGVGLSLIQALTDRVELRGAAGDGTEVRMSFHADAPIGPEAATTRSEAGQPAVPPSGETVVSVSAGPLAAPVLSRVVGILAARAGFSVDRLADAQLLSDAIAAHAPGVMIGAYVHVAVDAEDHALALRIGPLEPGGGARIVGASALVGMPALLEQLADEVEIAAQDGTEELRIALADRR